MTDIQEEIIILGLNEIISGSNTPLKKLILEKHANIFESRLSKVSTNIQAGIVEGMFIENPKVFYEDFWRNYINEAISVFDDASEVFCSTNGAWFVLLNRIKDMTGNDVDWFGVLCKLSLAVASSRRHVKGFALVLEWLTNYDKKNLVKLMHRTETKRYPKAIKVKLYMNLIESGQLDIKMARRIRSDTSGDLSSRMLAHLFESRCKYDDDSFGNLITQFSDTKHKWVARYIAVNMPISLAPFLMGLNDELAVKILEKRMNSEE